MPRVKRNWFRLPIRIWIWCKWKLGKHPTCELCLCRPEAGRLTHYAQGQSVTRTSVCFHCIEILIVANMVDELHVGDKKVAMQREPANDSRGTENVKRPN